MQDSKCIQQRKYSDNVTLTFMQSWYQGGFQKWLVKADASKGVTPDLKKQTIIVCIICDTMIQLICSEGIVPIFNLPQQ